MATKRKRGDDKKILNSPETLRHLLTSAITAHESAQIALLHIMEEYEFSLSALQQILLEEGLDVSFSNVRYEDVVVFVGLDPSRQMKDIGTFDLNRSRIPTAIFKSIVEDMDIMLVQYGPLPDHETEEARSRFLSPIFNRLAALFGFAFRNLPESTISGRIATKGRIEYYFRAFGSVSVLFIEIKLRIGSTKERLDAIAQVIAKCDACDWNNTRLNFAVPVYGILCDGSTFEFFLFDGSTKPYSFSRGCLPGDPLIFRNGLRLEDFTKTETPRPFILTLRPICEIIFDLLLRGYISSLNAYRSRSSRKSEKEQKLRKSLDKWDEAVKFAEEALKNFQEADAKRHAGLIDESNKITQEALK